jgi:hypothetical protein
MQRKKNGIPVALEIKNMKVEDPFLKCHNLKLEGNYDVLTSQEFYRKTLSDKIQVETLFRKELMRLVKSLHDMKREKQELIKRNSEYVRIIKHEKDLFIAKKDQLDNFRKDLDKKVQTRKMQRMSVFQKNLEDSEMFEINSKIQQLANQKEKEFEKFKLEYIDAVDKYTQLSNYILNEKTKFEVEIKKTKLMLTFLMKDQINYYTEILKKGIDVRSEGLCWIIRRLIELNGPYDYQSFPRFLENNQIDYIIKLAKKQTENIHYTIILKIMKSKQIKIRQEKEKDYSRISGGFNQSNSGTNNFQNISNTLYGSEQNLYLLDYMNETGFYRESLSNKVHKILENIFKKNDTMMKINYEQKIEEFQVSISISKGDFINKTSFYNNLFFIKLFNHMLYSF